MLSREKIRIENRWLYPSAIVDQLRIALSNGAELHADESRRKFYDLDTEGRTYFIYVSPCPSPKCDPRRKWRDSPCASD
jgi:hypothetical protein